MIPGTSRLLKNAWTALVLRDAAARLLRMMVWTASLNGIKVPKRGRRSAT